MANVVIFETDQVFAAVLEDRLHVAGYRASTERKTSSVVELSSEKEADLVVLGDVFDAASCVEAVSALRRSSDTRAASILVLSARGGTQARVEALRAGADDYVTKPCNLEELLLRIERLVGDQATGKTPQLEGNLQSQPLWEVLQYVQSARKSGQLLVRGKAGSGRLRIGDGIATKARFEGLTGSEALMAMLDLGEGRFHLVTDLDETVSDDPVQPLGLNQVMMEAAWLQDELQRRREHLPATGAPLRALAMAPPLLPKELEKLPVTEIFERVSQEPGTRLFDLLAEIRQAPQKIRLAVAWMIEQDVLSSKEGVPATSPPTTSEIAQSVLVEGAVVGLLSVARQNGFGNTGVPYLILAEPETWSELTTLLVKAPPGQEDDPIPKLMQQLQLRHGGSATFEVEDESLSLHVQRFTERSAQIVDTVVPVCAGVMVWLHRGEPLELLRSVIRRVETTSRPTRGILIANTPPARRAAAELTEQADRWLVTLHPPKSLLGVFRLFHPLARG